jgi:NADH:ubiquinone reductase (H+-translocating)
MVRMPSRRVVIVGGGLAGLFAARSLGSSDVAVTLVDRAQRRLFQPLRYQVRRDRNPVGGTDRRAAA